ncbi:MAG: hypothetical protein ACFFBD_29060, partial [Candidatus Hodarchaeota archaeon]
MTMSLGLIAFSLSDTSHNVAANTLTPTDERIWNLSGDGEYIAKSVAVDAWGNIYVTGYFNQLVGDDYDVFVRKFKSDLTVAWTITWGGDEDDHAEDIAIDADGNIVVVGGSQSLFPGLTYHVFVARFDTNGNQIDNATRSSNFSEFLWAVDIGPDGRIYTAGDIHYTGVGLPNHYDALYIIWDWTLTPVVSGTWLNGALINNDRAYDIKATVDSGFVIVGETESVGAGLYDGFIALYEGVGILIKNQTWGGSQMESFRGVVIDDPYNIYVAGMTKTGLPAYAAVLLRYNSTLDVQWNTTYDVSGNDLYYDVCLNSEGYIYTTGYTYNTTTKSDTL